MLQKVVKQTGGSLLRGLGALLSRTSPVASAQVVSGRPIGALPIDEAGT